MPVLVERRVAVTLYYLADEGRMRKLYILANNEGKIARSEPRVTKCVVMHLCDYVAGLLRCSYRHFIEKTFGRQSTSAFSSTYKLHC